MDRMVLASNWNPQECYSPKRFSVLVAWGKWSMERVIRQNKFICAQPNSWSLTMLWPPFSV